jgi:hypothetical protein
VQDGLARLPAGAGTVRLYAIHGRALAAHGERGQAAAAIEAAGKARAEALWDDLHDGVGGEFAFDDAKLWYYQALTWLMLTIRSGLSMRLRSRSASTRAFRHGPGRTAARPWHVFSSRGPG